MKTGRGVRLAALLAVSALIVPEHLLAIHRDKTMFLSQPSDYTPQVDESHKAPTLVFQPAWTWSGFKAALVGNPIECDGAIAVASRTGELAALEPLKGEAAWVVDLGEALTEGPATDGARLFIATTVGRLHALQGHDGTPLWTVDLPGAPVVAPRVIGSRVLVGTADGSLLSIETESGRVAARCLLPGRPSTTAEPAPDSILIGTDHGAVLALRESTLEILFRHDVTYAITSPPVFEKPRVWFAAADRKVHCLRFRSGRESWVARIGAESTAHPMIHGPYLYVMSYDNDIYVFNKRNGHQMTRIRMGHRLDSDAAILRDHVVVVPFTEASVVGLKLPGLQKVGKFDLKAPGEWFTTAPLWVADRVTVGYGRNEGRVLSLAVSEQAAPAKPAAGKSPEPKPAEPSPPPAPAPGAASPR